MQWWRDSQCCSLHFKCHKVMHGQHQSLLSESNQYYNMTINKVVGLLLYNIKCFDRSCDLARVPFTNFTCWVRCLEKKTCFPFLFFFFLTSSFLCQCFTIIFFSLPGKHSSCTFSSQIHTGKLPKTVCLVIFVDLFEKLQIKATWYWKTLLHFMLTSVY